MVKISLAVRLLQKLCYHLSFRHSTELSGSVRLCLQLFCAVQAGTSLLWQQRGLWEELPEYWKTLKLPASKNNPKKPSQKQLPCQSLHNPVYLSHILYKSIRLLNSTESTSNLLKREQDTMNIFWSGTVQYLWPFFPTTIMLQMHFMRVDLVREAGICKTLQMQQSIMSTLPERTFCYAASLDWAACLNIRLNPFRVKCHMEVLQECS